MSPAPSTSAWYPWLAPATNGIEGELAVDTFVTGLTDVLPVSPSPGAEPWRFDTGDPDPSTWPLMGLRGGGALVVVHGPVLVDGSEWYLVTPAQLVIDAPTGWARREAEDGTPLLGPSDLRCPGNPTTAEELTPLQLTDGLAACYGAEDVVITGDLSCDPLPDAFVAGATWLDSGTCRLDGVLATIYGLDAATPPGRYAVTGHFNDPEAAACTDPDDPDDPFGLVRLNAVLACRRSFVATAIEAR
jgi:hypothetical protein